MDSIFARIDNYNHTVFGLDPVGAVKNVRVWRRYLAALVVASVVGWAALGWESTWNQVSEFFQYLPAFLSRQISLGAFDVKVAQYYGVGQHLSTAVIYGVCFLVLSIYLEKINIVKSMNFFVAASLSFMSIGIYEIVYNILYSSFQGQSWAFTLGGHQMFNLVVFYVFILVGVLTLFYLYTLHYRPRVGKLTLFFVGGSVLTYVLWVFYPFATTVLTVQTSVGFWTSSHLFPQTMYAININPLGHGGNGVPYSVPNFFLHFVNIVNKALVSLSVLSFTLIRKK